jgi:hypothetical protein
MERTVASGPVIGCHGGVCDQVKETEHAMNQLRVFALFVLCGVTALIVAGGSVSVAAAAEPAFYECVKTEQVGKGKEKHYTGRYDDKKCSEKDAANEGEYELQEWNEAAKGGETKIKAFKGDGKNFNFEIQGLGGFNCTKSTMGGKVTSLTTLGEMTITLKGCVLLAHPCESTSPQAEASGEIVTKPLAGRLGYISKTRDEVGLEIKGESAPYIAEFNCGELKYRWSGAEIAAVKPPYNVFTKDTVLVFEQSGGVERPDQLEGGGVAQLYTEVGSTNGSEYSEQKKLSAWASEITNVGEELELKA